MRENVVHTVNLLIISQGKIRTNGMIGDIFRLFEGNGSLKTSWVAFGACVGWADRICRVGSPHLKFALESCKQ
jgi:hypothetical protein